MSRSKSKRPKQSSAQAPGSEPSSAPASEPRAAPPESTPIRLPWMTSPVPWSKMPWPSLPEMMLPAPAAVPPTRVLVPHSTEIPSEFPMAAVPAASVPMKLPSIVVPVAPSGNSKHGRATPDPSLPEMRFPCPGPVPPSCTRAVSKRETPVLFGRARSPAADVPMRLP